MGACQMIVNRMQERSERISLRIRALRPQRQQVVEVETPHFIVCRGVNGGGMGSTKHSIRAGRRNGRF